MRISSPPPLQKLRSARSQSRAAARLQSLHAGAIYAKERARSRGSRASKERANFTLRIRSSHAMLRTRPRNSPRSYPRASVVSSAWICELVSAKRVRLSSFPNCSTMDIRSAGDFSRGSAFADERRPVRSSARLSDGRVCKRRLRGCRLWPCLLAWCPVERAREVDKSGRPKESSGTLGSLISRITRGPAPKERTTTSINYSLSPVLAMTPDRRSRDWRGKPRARPKLGPNLSTGGDVRGRQTRASVWRLIKTELKEAGGEDVRDAPPSFPSPSRPHKRPGEAAERAKDGARMFSLRANEPRS